MEDILSYIIIFGLIITFTWIIFSKKEKGKVFSLTKKIYSYGTIEVFVNKKGKEIENLTVTVDLKETDSSVHDIKVELIDNKRNIEEIEILNESIIKKSKISFLIDFKTFQNELKTLLQKNDLFRFSVTLNNRKKLKTGSMAFNKNWAIYVPDTGKYN